MTKKSIDKINIGLIIISLLMAFSIPFKLFLISYSILGPLHYLTEIIWLRDKNFFVKQSSGKWVIVLFIAAILISILPIVSYFSTNLSKTFTEYLRVISEYTNTYLLIALLFSFGLVFFKKNYAVVITLSVAIALAWFTFTYIPIFLVLLGLFLPTIIHIYVFTLFFILIGAKKTKGKYAYISAILLLLVPFLIFKSHIQVPQLSTETIKTFTDSGILLLSSKIADILNLLENGKFLAVSENGIKIQIFISFAYTYHYLNWFSKTSIIGWDKNITKKEALVILFIWLISIGVYLYDFKTGFITLFFLSFLHVLLEFPLNIVSIISVFSKQKTNTKCN